MSLFTLSTGERPALPLYSRWLASWLATMGSGFALGADLLELIPMGVNAGTAEADRLLEGAEAAGWIRSTGPAPTVSQRFFGLPSVRSSKVMEYAPRSWHGWEPGEKWLDACRFVKEQQCFTE